MYDCRTYQNKSIVNACMPSYTSTSTNPSYCHSWWMLVVISSWALLISICYCQFLTGWLPLSSLSCSIVHVFHVCTSMYNYVVLVCKIYSNHMDRINGVICLLYDRCIVLNLLFPLKLACLLSHVDITCTKNPCICT